MASKDIVFNCEKCGDVDSILVDGYGIGDRLLEGVMFNVTNKDGELTAEITPDDKEYFEQFNANKWYKECVEYVKEHIGDVAGQCPKCNGDIAIEER